MAIGTQHFTITQDVTTLVGEFHIKTKGHVGVWLQRIDNSLWDRMSSDDFDMVNNTVVPNSPILASVYNQARLRIVSDVADLEEDPTDIEIISDNIIDINAVADDLTNIDTVATNIADVNTTATNIANVNTTGTNIASVNTVSGSIANVNTVAAQDANITAIGTDIIPNITEILQADTNAATATTKAAEASTSATAAAASASSASSSATDAANSAVEAASYTPSQTGNAGKFLTTDGSDASWAEVVGVEHYSQETEPTPQSVGATWYKPSTNFMYIYVNDGTQDLWLDVSTAGGGDTNLDGGSASTVYTTQQSVDGGNA